MLGQVPPLGFKGVFFSAPCAALITGLLCLIAAKGEKMCSRSHPNPSPLPPTPSQQPELYPCVRSAPLALSTPPLPFLMNCGTNS